jgi:hypothetical protein
MSISTSPRAIRHVSPLPDVVGLGGALAGLGGGLAMAVVAALLATTMGDDVWLQPKLIAAVVYGPAAASQPGFVAAPVLVGTLIHIVVSVVLGAIFGIVTRRVLHLTSDFWTPVLAGLIYGMLLWMAAYFVVLPIVDPALLETYSPAFILQHLVYGMVTGLLYMWLRPAPYNP